MKDSKKENGLSFLTRLSIILLSFVSIAFFYYSRYVYLGFVFVVKAAVSLIFIGFLMVLPIAVCVLEKRKESNLNENKGAVDGN